MVGSYQELKVWQKAIETVLSIYELTDQFPKEEQFGLISQMRRSSISIASNIAEGRYRGTRKDFRNFLRIAFGSGAELETQIIITKKLSKTKHLDYSKSEAGLSEMMKMLNVMIRNLAPQNLKANP